MADFAAGRVCEETVVVPLARGCALPDTVDGDVRFERGGLRIEMLHARGAAGRRVDVSVQMPRFAGRGLVARLSASYPPHHETLNVVVPWSERRFQFTAKHNTLPVRGSVNLGAGSEGPAEEIRFAGSQAFGCLDFGRGIWPYRCAWNWGAASGVAGGRVVGLNLGGKWTDGTGATENAVCVDGRLAKIDADLVWEYDPADWMRPWRIFDPGRHAVELEFAPVLERVASTRAVVVHSEVHQLFGHYRGRIRAADGQWIELDGLLGWAEDHHARW